MGYETQNDFEKKLFMAINLLRYDPKRYVPIVKKVHKESELTKQIKNTQNLIDALNKTEGLTQVKFDEFANQAVRENNKAQVEAAEETPAIGGNIEAYNRILGTDKTADCEEFTMCKFDSDQAQNFVAMQLLLDFNGGKLAAKPVETPVVETEKKDAEAAEVADGEKPKEVEKENEPKGDHSILLDPLLSTVGISLKGHPKTTNLIQVLYVKSAPNAMM
eukprot:CAMPEP_0176382378 /NCGR_PEP_ID=MMETSP0126-20121128/32640_1 /TAXON_ID=141414 ORGANISM="Strombidinopsis acuminatum, Strain SPMC142" /NCGR_SAMPLE_ID=MMETSP0126 /ASSEMBLY_ACC=CAM_ASM_000229 /LENGTH=218 /DNA_ID=CAMNT_0017746779 /DNA_START=105 /DNA_END=762 /DNA_ORIENTATION=-